MTTAASTSVSAPATADEIALPGLVEQYLYFRPMALAIPAEQVKNLNFDTSNVVLNGTAGVAELAPHRDAIATVPGISLDKIDSLAPLGQALLYTTNQVDRIVPTTGEVREMIERASEIRRVLLLKADVLVADGIVPASVVAGIRKGRGAIDIAGDCVALAALFHDYATQLVGHVKVSGSDVATANDVGGKLLVTLRPETALPAATKDADNMADMRDRMWTLYDQIWEQHVWRAGAWLFGRGVEHHIPLLGSRVLGRRKPAPVPPTPPTPPTPA